MINWEHWELVCSFQHRIHPAVHYVHHNSTVAGYKDTNVQLTTVRNVAQVAWPWLCQRRTFFGGTMHSHPDLPLVMETFIVIVIILCCVLCCVWLGTPSFGKRRVKININFWLNWSLFKDLVTSLYLLANADHDANFVYSTTLPRKILRHRWMEWSKSVSVLLESMSTSLVKHFLGFNYSWWIHLMLRKWHLLYLFQQKCLSVAWDKICFC